MIYRLGYEFGDKRNKIRFPAGIFFVTSRSSLGVKQPGREADHFPQSSTKIKHPMQRVILSSGMACCVIL
jgi:hypothetical protein